MANPLDRVWYNTLVDDDGSGNVGTVWNKAQVNSLLNTVDASLAPVVVTPSPVDIAIGPKTVPRLEQTYTGSTTKARVLAAVADWAGVTLNANFNTGVWARDDATKNGVVISLLPSVPFQVSRFDANGVTAIVSVYPDGRIALDGAGQIQFPVTPVLSADPTTIDAYRRGSFAPSLTGSGGGSGQVYSIRNGRFTRFGDTAICSGHIALATVGTMAGGEVKLTGFPYPKVGDYEVGTVVWASIASPIASMAIRIDPGQNFAYLIYTAPGGAATQSYLPPSLLAPGADLIFSLAYQVA